ncbi:hypothetical protein NSE_0539 [Neorickettsia sennetsu str. Miyayama]|uniref:Uncharacterized protein n=2 Tax=Ehrlichia sennetsu TaxID=951 RepID=Q2GDM4_EHRS3|nr:hypothetical protein NSE_0539 [Neorickettsia sennetsu str. Miyayama]
MDLQEIQKLETLLFKLRKSDGEKWNFKLLSWSQERGTLSLEFSGTDDEHLVVAVEKNKGESVATGKIFIKVQESINLGTSYASILFYDGSTVALITEGKPFRPSSFLGYCGAFFQGVNYNLSQVNYHVFSGTLCLSLAGAVRSPTVDGRFFVWPFSQAEINVERVSGSSQCRCTVKKIKAVERNANLHYRFNIPGAYMCFDTKDTQYFISGHGILLSHGELSDFADQSKCFAARGKVLDSLSAYLNKNCNFMRVRSWLFHGGKELASAALPNTVTSSAQCSSQGTQSASQKPSEAIDSKVDKKSESDVSIHARKLSVEGASKPVSEMNDASTITHYFPKVRKR